MKRHVPMFSEVIRGRCSFAGINQTILEKKAGISHTTMSRRMTDGNWTRDQLKSMNRYLHFTDEDMRTFLEGR